MLEKKGFIEKKINDQVKKSIANDFSGATTLQSEISISKAPTTAVFTESDQAELAVPSEISISTVPTAAVLTESGQAEELLTLKNKYKICEKNLKLAKNLLKKSSQLNLENNEKNTTNILFESFAENFENQDMIEIRSIASGSKKDSTFISKIMHSFYKNDLSKLNDRSATGKKFNGIKKHEITFEKKKVMEKMLIERVKCELNDISCTSKEFLARVGRLNTLIRFAIGNLLPKKRMF